MNPDDMIERLSGRLSLRRRIATVVAMLGGLTVAAVVGLLWATEPGLPPRTQLAFGAIVVAGLAWFGYGLWALTWRLPLFALDRVVAAWMGLAACGLVAVPVAAIAISRHRLEAVALTTVAALLVMATVNLIRARAHRTALLRRRRELGGS
jgi:hypothetical protein